MTAQAAMQDEAMKRSGALLTTTTTTDDLVRAWNNP